MNRNNSNGINKTNGNTPVKNSSSSINTKTTNSSVILNNSMVATNETIKIVSESIGITNLNEESARELASDLTFIVKSILTDAQKYARRSRRKKIVPSDIDYALKTRALEPIYGFTSTDQVPFRCATSTGGNGSGRFFYSDDQVIDLVDLITSNNKSVKIPNDLTIHPHWLAIEGIQPSVPENPQLITREMQKREAIEGVLGKSKEAQNKQQQLSKRSESLVKLKSLISHDLSIEQQIYFKEVTEACVGGDEQKRTEALNSLSTDPGLHQLLPRIILFISEGVRLNIIQQNMPILIHLMRMAKSLSENKSIYLEKYLHELLPSIFSCVLSKQVCSRPEIDNHCALREFCANLVGQIVKTYRPIIPSLQTRIIKIYLNSLQSEYTTFATLFGAISGLTELGSDICESFIFPLVKMIGERITQILDSSASQPEKLPADKVKQQLVRSISSILKPRQIPNEYDYLITEFGAYFGPVIHSQLCKLRGFQQNNIQAQMVSNISQKTVYTPHLNRTQPLSTNLQNSPCISNQQISLSNATLTSKVMINNISASQTTQSNSMEVISPNNSHSKQTVSQADPTTNDNNFQVSSDFRSKTVNIVDNSKDGSRDFSLKITENNPDFVNDTILMNIDSTHNFHANLQTELITPGFALEGNTNNMSNLTSDSNNTNNMTTSDVNLSDNVENTEHL